MKRVGGRAAVLARAVVGVVVGAVVLGGCTGPEAAPSPTPTPSVTEPVETTSPSATPSPTVTASADPFADGVLTDEELIALLPADASGPGYFGAEATAIFFLEQWAPMFHTGNTLVWEALSTSDCGYCSGQRADMESVQEAEFVVTGGEIVPLRDDATGVVDPDGTAQVRVPADIREAQMESPDGEKRTIVEGGSETFVVALEYVDGIWHVAGVQLLDL